MSEISIKLAAGTNVGLVRKNNEDNFVVNRDLCQSEWIIPQSIEPIYDVEVFVPSDKMGDVMGDLQGRRSMKGHNRE